MERKEIEKQLNQILIEIFAKPDLVIHDKMTAKDIPGWDSLNHINIIVSAEKSFNVKFTTKDIQNLANVGDFIDLIQRKL